LSGREDDWLWTLPEDRPGETDELGRKPGDSSAASCRKKNNKESCNSAHSNPELKTTIISLKKIHPVLFGEMLRITGEGGQVGKGLFKKKIKQKGIREGPPKKQNQPCARCAQPPANPLQRRDSLEIRKISHGIGRSFLIRKTGKGIFLTNYVAQNPERTRHLGRKGQSVTGGGSSSGGQKTDAKSEKMVRENDPAGVLTSITKNREGRCPSQNERRNLPGALSPARQKGSGTGRRMKMSAKKSLQIKGEKSLGGKHHKKNQKELKRKYG